MTEACATEEEESLQLPIRCLTLPGRRRHEVPVRVVAVLAADVRYRPGGSCRVFKRPSGRRAREVGRERL